MEQSLSGLTKTIKAHEAELIRYACRLLNDWDKARDVVQETFIRFVKVQNENDKKSVENAKAWLYKVARNICLDILRSKEKRFEQPLDDNADRLACPGKAPDKAYKISEEAQMLRVIINNLEPREKEILTLKMEHGKTYKEIAEIMELSASNVGFILHNTMRKLRNEFRSAGGETK
jgi:RNA polymerase sigma-70 factor (ECF subfamily)